jgi:hypothetical protein
MDVERNLTMSHKELNRLQIIGRVIERRLPQWKAAEQLDLGVRQVQRLCHNLREHGPCGLVSRKRGRPSNRRTAAAVRDHVVDLVRSRYADFGPTLASEKLAEADGVTVSVETLRKWMIEAGLWIPRARRRGLPHQPQSRRSCLGELVQIDGCEHAWFEDRGPKCTLLVYVDDATSRLMELRFVESESAFDYFTSTKTYLRRYGKPVAFYSDKSSIFRVTGQRPAPNRPGITQFGRALSELNIDILCANTPQAKGRVERAHQTLQDRLVKELRLRDIATSEAGNRYLPAFMAAYNKRFAREPQNPHDAHRPLRRDKNLEEIFTWQEERRLTNNLTVTYKRVTYLIDPGPDTIRLRGQTCRVHEHHNGRVEIFCNGVPLPYQIFCDRSQRVDPSAVIDNKRLGGVLRQIQEEQKERDKQPRPSRTLSLREKRLLRLAEQRAAEIGQTAFLGRTPSPDISTLEEARHF